MVVLQSTVVVGVVVDELNNKLNVIVYIRLESFLSRVYSICICIKFSTAMMIYFSIEELYFDCLLYIFSTKSRDEIIILTVLKMI